MFAQPVLPKYEKAYEIRMARTMKINPFISTLPPKNSITTAKKAMMMVMEILVLTATVFSKLALLPPKSKSIVATTRATNNKIIFKLNPSTTNLSDVK